MKSGTILEFIIAVASTGETVILNHQAEFTDWVSDNFYDSMFDCDDAGFVGAMPTSTGVYRVAATYKDLSSYDDADWEFRVITAEKIFDIPSLDR